MIIIEGVSKTFKQGADLVCAVKDVNLRIGEGERVYIHGPSGAGKSTLLHVIGGLRNPTEGTVKLRDRDIYSLGDRERSRLRNRSFGFVFQFYHLLSELNVLENVALPAKIKGGRSGKKIKARAVELLEKVNMQDRLKHRPNQISGGEAQRTAIARALVNSPDVLFCDEPAGNLDSELSREIYGLIHEISEEDRMSVVVVSHEGLDRDFFHSEYQMKDGMLGKVTSDKIQMKEIKTEKEKAQDNKLDFERKILGL